jgi:hypothetical protein
MATTKVDEFVTKIEKLPKAERDELLRRLNESPPKSDEPKVSKTNGKKGYVSPDTIWVKENHAKFAGKHVALKNGKLIAVGNTMKEVVEAAKSLGVDRPRITYLFPLDHIPFGGW